ncbi:hypothetical protein STEG23_006310, partial [Scotinomys teguina]
ASYQRQYRNEILSQSAVQVLVGAAGSFGEKKGEYMTPENIKNYSESKKLLSFIRKVLLNWVYNTKKDKGVPSRYLFLHICHKIVFTDAFEYTGYLAVLMSIYPMVICWISRLKDIYEYEIKCANYYFLNFYTLEALLKMAAMRKEFFSHTWLLLELAITLVGIIDVILIETNFISYNVDITETVIIMNIVRLLRILRILKLITPKLLHIIDKRMSHEISFRYAVLKGYVQGEMDVLNIIDQIASSKQTKKILLQRVMRNMERAMKEIGYLEYDHPETAVTMKTKEEINVMLNMAREIVKAFRSKGIIHKIEDTEINKLIMAKKIEVLELQSVIQPLKIEESPFYIPWLNKEPEMIRFVKQKAKVLTFDCGNNIFEEGDEPEGIYVIISGMVKLKSSKPQLEVQRLPSESAVKTHPLFSMEYLLSGEIIGELNCLTKEPMQFSATCKTVVETYFIPISHLYEAFEKKYPNLKHKMWQKIGLGITAQKIREHLSFEDWNYKMQLKLCNVFVRDIPKTTKTDIYDETVTHVVLIHGSAEDCQLRKIYKAPFLIPVTCYQIQGLEEYTKVMIIQTSVAERKFRWNVKKYIPPRRPSVKPDFKESLETLDESSEDEKKAEEEPCLVLKVTNPLQVWFPSVSWSELLCQGESKVQEGREGSGNTQREGAEKPDGELSAEENKVEAGHSGDTLESETSKCQAADLQDSANQIYTEELCYILVDHKALRGRPSDSSAEGFYENVSSEAERRRASSRGIETEYSALRFSSTPQPPPPAEGEYELLVPSPLSFHACQQPRPLTAPLRLTSLISNEWRG